MGYLNTRGIVIREVNVGEADKIITVFSQSHGKISASAKGSRRSKSRLIAGTQFLCYSDFVFFKGRELFLTNSCEVIEPFYEIRNDIEKLTYSAHMVELINDIIQENQPSNRVLQLFLNSLFMLAKTKRNPELISRIFELRLLSVAGYAPYVRGCVICGREDLGDNVFFSFEKCGFICSDDKCKDSGPHAQKLSIGASKALCHIVLSKIENLFNFDVSREVLDELGKISRRYLRDRLEKDYTKLDFLKALDI
jgi:DNA repair protein RecO (recombination protein O)